MLMITIPTADLPLLHEKGVPVKINGHRTLMTMESLWLIYKDAEGNQNRCRVLEFWPDDDCTRFTCNSHGDDDAELDIIR
jgi:hypothetical protein